MEKNDLLFCIRNMKMLILISVLMAWASGASLQAAPASLRVRVDQPGHPVAPTLWGLFFEDINLSADGGIYAEMVRNRSFEDSDQPEHWTLIERGGGKGEISISLEHPAAEDILRTRNRRSLRLRIQQAEAGSPVGVANEGYWGVPARREEACDLTFHVRRDDGFKGPLTVALEGQDGRVLAKKTISGITPQWKRMKVSLIPEATDTKARLVFTAASPGVLWLDKVSLFPRQTWKNHGLRPDLAEMLADLQPSFVRFPGGCWVEGDTMKEAYRWKETMGDIWERRTQWNIWGYWATHGLGFHEYLQMCEDLGAEPLFVINCGMSHRENVPMDQMGPFVQDALDAIEYANGPVHSLWGGLRARNGHPEPFHLKYLEIGNENGGPAYQERYALMYGVIKERYPEMILIANDWGGVPTNAPIEIIDEHYYNTPEFFMRQAGRYDRYDRKGPKIYVGEYAVTQNGGRGNLRAALGEAAFMTGMERNSDVVVMASYAPLFVHVNHRRWNPDLINFDNARAYGIPGYYVQQLFSEHRGDVTLPIALESPETEEAPSGGAIGVGTWLTQAEFKDIKVTHNGETLYQCDFAHGTGGWKLLGGGRWEAEQGILRQTSRQENIRAVVGNPEWSDYTYTLKARKIAGEEGFLILFRVKDPNGKSWWNLGGWGNKMHGIEMGGVVSQKPGSIETNRWYDIKIEVKGRSVRCYLDGQLVHDVTPPTLQSLYASATRDTKRGEVILKVVNVNAEALTTDLELSGASRVAPSARLLLLTSDKPTDENSLDEPTKVAPVSKDLSLDGPRFQHVFPGNSFTVLRIKAE